MAEVMERPELSCNESRLLLKVMTVEKNWSDMKSEEMDALKHYYHNCSDCQIIGLTGIKGVRLSCREALETWAEKPGPLYLGTQIESLKDLLAVEHVWGRKVNKEKGGFEDVGACNELPCQELSSYWARAPLCSGYDGWREVAGQIPLTMRIFQMQDWPLDNLLDIQKRRVDLLLKSFKEGKILISPGSYHTFDDCAREIYTHVEILQDIARRRE